MDKEQVLSIIRDANDDSVYLADVQTHALIYLNPAACQLLGTTEGAYAGRKCYEVLHGLDAPCPFCTNHRLSQHCFYTWRHDNAALGRQFLRRDRRMLQIQAIDEALLLCIDTLKNGTDTGSALNSLLAYIGMFYRSGLVNIYEIDRPTQSLSLTYSWSGGDGPARYRHKFDLGQVAGWFDAFDTSGVLSVTSVEEALDHSSPAYQFLHAQKVRSFLAAPLLEPGGSLIGVIAVGNPTLNLDAPQLLRSVAAFIVDSIAKRTLLEQVERLSRSDALTGLRNRHSYLERLQEFQDHAPPSLGIICLDIDGIRQANDTYGSTCGDAMLVHTANILTSLCSQDVYRVGGDQFVVLCPGIGQESFQFLTERLRRTVREADDLSVSIGSKWTQGQADAVEQAVDASKLMSQEKESYYHSLRTNRDSFYSRIRDKLMGELSGGQFSVLLQPQIGLDTGRVVGAEALVRKRGSAGEMVSPAMFIPYYEEEGLVQSIDMFVLETVCAALAQWSGLGVSLPRISVNFSRVTLMEEAFMERLSQICRCYQIPPRQIGIEITESSTKMDVQLLSHLVKRLRTAGFAVFLDDFGARYSNLSILSKIDFDCIKIDKSLVDSIVTNPKAHTIVEHTISMGRALSRTSAVAEGIETADQLALLTQLGCDVGQGYLFSRPIPIPAFFQQYLS